MRNTIRETWLNESYWESVGIDIHVVFIIGSVENTLADEVMTHGDILQVNFTESHYMLPMKDVAYLNYIQEQCPEADFVFKGDDDILVVPENVATMVEKMKVEKIPALGCIKEHEPVVRNPTSKYFVPPEIFENDKYSNYYSGAAYIVNGQLALEMAKRKQEVPLMPLDDCYIGSIIEHLGKELFHLVISRWRKRKEFFDGYGFVTLIKTSPMRMIAL